MKRFQDQVAFITGGADGLGRAIAKLLADEGAKVAVFDRDPVLAEKAAGELSGLAIAGDVSDEKSVAGAYEQVFAKWGRLDVVVNSAGIVGPSGRKLTDVSVEEFDAVYRVNLRGSFLVAKYAIPYMEKRNYGRVLLIASIAGKEGNAGMSAYSSTKAGVIGLAKSIGKEYAETGITVNALAPAVIRTAMVEGMDPGHVKYMTDKIPMKRCGTLAEIAALTAFIVSPEASFTTGFTFDMSGGRATY
ncbi:MAG: SDR family NAD(P)-dependent oxidoreductase [Polyangiaceae bacterium]|nr:SDR family NAD(P)-dependent oxidoreductase [Polyangiaceae bacterium]